MTNQRVDLTVVMLMAVRYVLRRLADTESQLEEDLREAGVCDYCFKPKSECNGEKRETVMN
jgi:hypothetical protein